MAKLKTDNREMRVLTPEDVELRVEEGETPKLVGYAAKFNKWSADLGGFREKIARKAFDDVLNDDVRALKNHDSNLLLGRSPKTLKLSTNSVGLRFEIDMPDTTVGRDTIEEVRRGDISGCSFAFSTAEDDWKYVEDGSVERTLIKCSALYDVGPVTYPAYPDTSVAARSLDRIKAENEKREDKPSDEDTVVAEEVEDAEEVQPDSSLETPDGEKPEEILEDEQANTISAERQRLIEIGYRKAGRIIARCRPKAD